MMSLARAMDDIMHATAQRRPVSRENPGQIAPAADILLAHDGSVLAPEALRVLERSYKISEADIREGATTPPSSVLAVVVCINLSDPGSVRTIRERYVDGPIQIPRVFVLPNSDRRSVVQAYSAGAHQLMSPPLTTEAFTNVLAPLMDGSIEWLWGRLSNIQQSALRISLKLFEDTHTSVMRGGGLETRTVARTCNNIITAIGHEGFPSLLDALRSHHNYTFRHSMCVTGSLVAFADSLGFCDEDIGRAAMAGLLHDVGKVSTPNAILNKPSKLEPAEWAIMQRHAPDGAEILMRNGDWPRDVLDAVSHHHERLDGKGYCDGLSGGEICDLTRMVSIADMFSALIDKRAYKPPMPGREAFSIMRAAEGHLDQALVAAFEPIALAVK